MSFVIHGSDRYYPITKDSTLEIQDFHSITSSIGGKHYEIGSAVQDITPDTYQLSSKTTHFIGASGKDTYMMRTTIHPNDGFEDEEKVDTATRSFYKVSDDGKKEFLGSIKQDPDANKLVAGKNQKLSVTTAQMVGTWGPEYFAHKGVSALIKSGDKDYWTMDLSGVSLPDGTFVEIDPDAADGSSTNIYLAPVKVGKLSILEQQIYSEQTNTTGEGKAVGDVCIYSDSGVKASMSFMPAADVDRYIKNNNDDGFLSNFSEGFEDLGALVQQYTGKLFKQFATDKQLKS